MDLAEIDENGKGLLFYGDAPVDLCKTVEGQNNVYLLQTTFELERKSQLSPKPGQFYLIKSKKSNVNYNRPISVYHSEERINDNGKKELTVQFMILEKGDGTKELCHMGVGEKIVVIGPLGTAWPKAEAGLLEENCPGTGDVAGDAPGGESNAPGGAYDAPGRAGGSSRWSGNSLLRSGDAPWGADICPGGAGEASNFPRSPKIAIVGGGIGVAPVANLASSLPAGSYDFYASFKSGSYGLENVKAANLIITTDDGSVGIHGMLPAAFSKEAILAAGYEVIYACGPNPALAYVKQLAQELNIKCWISMEHRMLCGLGACLGCMVETTEGLKRCCKDGPVFDAKILEFPKPSANIRRKPLEKDEEPDISTEICGVKFKNPLIASAGTFAYGQNFRGLSDVAAWGGICSKGLTFEPRAGNKGERSLEVAGGNMNSIGLQNPGIPYFIENLLPGMIGLGPVVIANLAGSDIESYVEGAKLLDKTECDMIELNISCPNIKAAGLAWGMSAETAYYCVSSVRNVTSKPLMVKLSPNAPDNRPIALACIKAGADAISLINMIHGVAIDIDKGKPFFNNVHAGYSGPGLKPLALRIVYDVIEEINKLPPEERVPVIGIGGIQNWKDAVEFIMAGCSAIEIGQAKFTNPNVAIDVQNGLKDFMKSHGYHNLAEMRGIAQVKHQNDLGSGDERTHYKELKDMILSYLPVLPNASKKK